MAIEKVRIQHTHIPDVSIPEGDRSDIETRAVAWNVRVVMGVRAVKDVVVSVVTGDFTMHKDLAGQVADQAATEFDLPRLMSYESAVLIGLLSKDGQVSVVGVTHGSHEKPRIDDNDTYVILHMAAAGVARAIRRGYGFDMTEPSEELYDMDQLHEPINEEFDVTLGMLEEFEGDVRDGTVALTEEVSHSSSRKQKTEKPSVTKAIGSKLAGLAVNSDVFADDET